MKMQNRVKKHSLKFFSVFLSIFLWVYVLNSEKVKFEKTITLEYILPSDMVFAKRPISEITFLIEGPRAFVRSVAEKEERFTIDLIKLNPRHLLNFNVDVDPTQLTLPFGMIVERVLPRKIPISLEKKAGKIVPLRIQYLGKLPDKTYLHQPYLDPFEVEVYGPRSLINKLKELPIKPVELENLSGSQPLPVEVHLPDERFSLSPGLDVKFHYQIRASAPNLELKKVPINFLATSKKITSTVKTASIKLLVSERIMKNRSNVSSSIEVWADIPEKASGLVEVPLKVSLPPTIHLLEIYPKSIIVNIQ